MNQPGTRGDALGGAPSVCGLDAGSLHGREHAIQPMLRSLATYTAVCENGGEGTQTRELLTAHTTTPESPAKSIRAPHAARGADRWPRPGAHWGGGRHVRPGTRPQQRSPAPPAASILLLLLLHRPSFQPALAGGPASESLATTCCRPHTQPAPGEARDEGSLARSPARLGHASARSKQLNAQAAA